MESSETNAKLAKIEYERQKVMTQANMAYFMSLKERDSTVIGNSKPCKIEIPKHLRDKK